MTDSFGAPMLDRNAAEPSPAEAEAVGAVKRIAILPAPANPQRDSRPITNLGKVFGQFAELQQQIGEQVGALEESVHHQKQDLAAAMAQLPELRERINWLIASFYEQSKNDETLRDRLGRSETALEGLTETVRLLNDQHARWEAALDEVIASLMRAKSALSRQ
jgi:chromosome segregation ATPase